MEIILGDNPFIAVSHLQVEKSTYYKNRFSDALEIVKIIEHAYINGVRKFYYTNVSSYDEVWSLLEERQSCKSLETYICVPYAQKYNELIARSGLIKAVLQFCRFDVLRQILLPLIKMIIGQKKILSNLLLEFEILNSRDPFLKGVFVLNVLTDMQLANKNEDFFNHFIKQCEKRNLQPGLMSMNAPMLIDFLKHHEIDKSFSYCFNLNKTGYRMNPSKSDFISVFQNTNYNITAMNVISDFDNVDECFEFAIQSQCCNSIVFGSGNPVNISKNVNYINSILGS